MTVDSRRRAVIVGAGSSGFYTPEQLLGAGFGVGMIDKPPPFGLAMAGVAADHPEIKSVTRMFDKIAAIHDSRISDDIPLGEKVTRAERRDPVHYRADRVITHAGHRRRGEYAVRWIKRGPFGFIARNRKDPAETAASIAENAETSPFNPPVDMCEHVHEHYASRVSFAVACRAGRPPMRSNESLVDQQAATRSNSSARPIRRPPHSSRHQHDCRLAAALVHTLRRELRSRARCKSVEMLCIRGSQLRRFAMTKRMEAVCPT